MQCRENAGSGPTSIERVGDEGGVVSVSSIEYAGVKHMGHAVCYMRSSYVKEVLTVESKH